MRHAALPFIALLVAAAPPPPPPPVSIDGLPVGALPRQALPAQGCAAYLFTTGRTRALAAVATAQPGQLRLALDGRLVDLARDPAAATGAYGLAPAASYSASGITATLDLDVVERKDLVKGALVSEASLRLERSGGDTIIIPLAGLVGCA